MERLGIGQIVQIHLLIAKIRKIVKESGWQLGQGFNFEHAKFDMPAVHSNDNCFCGTGFRGNNEGSRIHGVYICTYMAFKAMRGNDIIQRMSNRERREKNQRIMQGSEHKQGQ